MANQPTADQDRNNAIAQHAFNLMQQLYPAQTNHCLSEARAQIAEQRLAELERAASSGSDPEGT